MLLNLALHPRIRERALTSGTRGGDQHVDFYPGLLGGFGEVDVDVVFEFVLVFEAACGAAGGCEGGEEDSRDGREGSDVGEPFGGVGFDEGGEFWLGLGGGWGAAGEGVDLGDGWVGEEGSEDVGAL